MHREYGILRMAAISKKNRSSYFLALREADSSNCSSDRYLLMQKVTDHFLLLALGFPE